MKVVIKKTTKGLYRITKETTLESKKTGSLFISYGKSSKSRRPQFFEKVPDKERLKQRIDVYEFLVP